VLWHKTTIGHIWRKLLVIGNNTSKRKIWRRGTLFCNILSTIFSASLFPVMVSVESVPIWCRIQFYSFLYFCRGSGRIGISTENVTNYWCLWDIMRIWLGCTNLLIPKVIGI
jgi:hypothetical protein